MRYIGLPSLMWTFARPSFHSELSETLRFSKEEAEEIITSALPEYKKIIAGLPTFEKGDVYEMNIVNCALFSSIILSMKRKPSVEEMTVYYSRAMMTPPVRLYYRMADRDKFSSKDIERTMKTAAFKAASRNPYSWNMDYLPYEDGSGYECRYDHCGIRVLMRELGIERYTSAMCHLDYDMNEAGGKARFVRKYTLASGGPYCDCGYKRR